MSQHLTTSIAETNWEAEAIEPLVDHRSTAELFAAALVDDDDQKYAAIAALHWRGTRDVLEHAIEHSTSAQPEKRMLSAAVLGQIGIPDRSFPDQCIEALTAMLQDQNIGVLEEAIIALSHADEMRSATQQVLLFADHDNADIRSSVAFNLAGNQRPEAISALIVLSSDSDSDTRDWATFGLGIQCDADSPEIRNALADRLTDDDDEVQLEAICGLAMKRDHRSLPFLIPMLLETPDDSSIREAAANLLGIEDHHSVTTVELIQSLSRFKKFRSV